MIYYIIHYTILIHYNIIHIIDIAPVVVVVVLRVGGVTVVGAGSPSEFLLRRDLLL
jgi:hypothetical protein